MDYFGDDSYSGGGWDYGGWDNYDWNSLAYDPGVQYSGGDTWSSPGVMNSTWGGWDPGTGWAPDPGGYSSYSTPSYSYGPADSGGSVLGGVNPTSLPSGTGYFSTSAGGGVVQPVSGYQAPTMGFYMGGGNSGFHDPVASTPSLSGVTSTLNQMAQSPASAVWQAQQGNFNSGGFGSQPLDNNQRGGGGGGGQTSNLGQPELFNPGVPERTLYDRYSALLQNPSSFAGDPAYQFLYNQGEQAMQRSQAANRMRYSGKSLNEASAYGQNMANTYLQGMLPQYRAGAIEELSRYMGPAGLMSQVIGQNNQTRNQAGASAASSELLPYYKQMLENSMGGGGGFSGGGMSSGGLAPATQPAIGMGGISSSTNPTRYSTAPAATPQPRMQTSMAPQEEIPPWMQYDYSWDGV